jgi:hypothetical protein
LLSRVGRRRVGAGARGRARVPVTPGLWAKLRSDPHTMAVDEAHTDNDRARAGRLVQFVSVHTRALRLALFDVLSPQILELVLDRIRLFLGLGGYAHYYPSFFHPLFVELGLMLRNSGADERP